MAKASMMVVAVAALCFSSLLGAAYATEQSFSVKGNVYCDTCRLEIFTRLSEPIEGATVTLVCRRTDDPKNVTFTKDAATDASGMYRVEVTGDHEDDICEVTVVKSPREDCNELLHRSFEKARVVLTYKDGIIQTDRFANPLAVLKEHISDRVRCATVIKELGLDQLASDQ